MTHQKNIALALVGLLFAGTPLTLSSAATNATEEELLADQQSPLAPSPLTAQFWLDRNGPAGDELLASSDDMTAIKEASNFFGVDLLPYHRMGVGKYVQLNMAYTLDANTVISERNLTAIQALFRDAGMNVAIIRH